MRTAPAVVHLHLCQGRCTRLGYARGCAWCDDRRKRSMFDHHTASSGCGHPVRTRTRARQDPSSTTSSWPWRRPAPGPTPCVQDAQDPSAGDNVLQDRPTRHFSSFAAWSTARVEVVIFSSDSGRPLPWPLRSSASPLRTHGRPCAARGLGGMKEYKYGSPILERLKAVFTLAAGV